MVGTRVLNWIKRIVQKFRSSDSPQPDVQPHERTQTPSLQPTQHHTNQNHETIPLKSDTHSTKNHAEGAGITQTAGDELLVRAKQTKVIIRDHEIPLYFRRYNITNIHYFDEGGTGVIYIGELVEEKTGTSIPVALKRYKKLSSEALGILAKEFELIGNLDVDSLPTIYGIDEDENGVPYLIMRYISGTPLCEVQKRDARALTWIMVRVAEVVRNLHRHGVLHLDLKPSNILLTEHNQIRLIDFGLTRAVVHLRQTEKGNETSAFVGGTPQYMAPEQFQGIPDIRTDVYCFGATFFHLLAGTPPFKRERWNQFLQTGELPSDLPIWPADTSIPEDLKAIVLKCMQPDPDKRYQNMDEVMEDLLRWLDGKPVRCLSHNKIYVLKKWIYTWRTLLITVSLLLIITGLVITSMYWLTKKRIQEVSEIIALASELEYALDSEYLLPFHSISNTVQEVRKVMDELAQKANKFAPFSRRKIYFAIGKSAYKLREYDRALYFFEKAWEYGHRSSSLAYYLVLTHHRIFIENMFELTQSAEPNTYRFIVRRAFKEHILSSRKYLRYIQEPIYIPLVHAYSKASLRKYKEAIEAIESVRFYSFKRNVVYNLLETKCDILSLWSFDLLRIQNLKKHIEVLNKTYACYDKLATILRSDPWVARMRCEILIERFRILNLMERTQPPIQTFMEGICSLPVELDPLNPRMLLTKATALLAQKIFQGTPQELDKIYEARKILLSIPPQMRTPPIQEKLAQSFALEALWKEIRGLDNRREIWLALTILKKVVSQTGNLSYSIASLYAALGSTLLDNQRSFSEIDEQFLMELLNRIKHLETLYPEMPNLPYIEALLYLNLASFYAEIGKPFQKAFAQSYDAIRRAKKNAPDYPPYQLTEMTTKVHEIAYELFTSKVNEKKLDRLETQLKQLVRSNSKFQPFIQPNFLILTSLKIQNELFFKASSRPNIQRQLLKLKTEKASERYPYLQGLLLLTEGWFLLIENRTHSSWFNKTFHMLENLEEKIYPLYNLEEKFELASILLAMSPSREQTLPVLTKVHKLIRMHDSHFKNRPWYILYRTMFELSHAYHDPEQCKDIVERSLKYVLSRSRAIQQKYGILSQDLAWLISMKDIFTTQCSKASISERGHTLFQRKVIELIKHAQINSGLPVKRTSSHLKRNVLSESDFNR